MASPGRSLRAFVIVLAAMLFIAVSPALPAEARGPVKVVSREVATSVDRQRVVELPIVASHVAIHWRGHEDAQLTVAFSDDGLVFGEPLGVEHDEAGGHATNGRTYGGVVWTEGARFVRVHSDRRIGQLSVVAINSHRAAPSTASFGSVAAAAVEQPAVTSRAGWGADESIRFDSNGNELWPRDFYPVQKLVVHHTAGRNSDPNPAATVRAIYHYHAVTRGWGDIGYNFLIDEAGRVYEGRFSRAYGANESPTGEDLNGNSVVGAHVAGHNAGTAGVALLGTLSTQDATPAAREALERLLAWKAERHGIDPMGGGTYTNPVSGLQKSLANISGHRDLAATDCPGGTFYTTLPALRQAVAERLSAPVTKTVPGAPVLSARTPPKNRGVRLDWTAPPDGGSPITSYRILRLKSGTFVRIATVNGSTLKYRDGTAKSGRTYTYRVRAVNAVGRGPKSNQASAVAR
jgi:hypothetical protein